jgi:hypothetical protein
MKRHRKIATRNTSRGSVTQKLTNGLLSITTVACLLVPASSSLYAQVAGTGTIEGTVTDASGAVVPAATIKATDVSTGRIFQQTTSGSGTYVLPALPPGEYRVEVTSASFRPLLQEHVTVNAVTVLGLNLSLQAGGTSDTVVVTSEAPSINTENGTLSTTIPNSTYTALPLALNGGPKSPVGFLSLVPGVTTNNSLAAYNFNGGAGNTSSLYLNGLPLQTSELGGDTRNLAATSTEIVDQFQVITGGVPAYYDGQGLANLVLKSGTNGFHGDVYENIRNTAFDAAGYFSTKTPVEHQNEFGFTLGGPVLRNRTFFFVSYDGYRLTNGTSPQLLTLPTVAEQGGNFAGLTPIYDPATTVCSVAGVCTRQQFPGNMIPMARISSVSQSLQSYLPVPQNQNTQNNFTDQFVSGSVQNMFVGKLDTDLSHSNHATLLYERGSVSPKGQSGLSGLPEPYSNGRLSSTLYYLGQVTDTQTITPKLLNLFGFELFQDPAVATVPTAAGNYPSKAGLTGLPLGVPSTAFPSVSFGGPESPTTWGGGAGSSQAFSEVSQAEIYQDNLIWSRGRHNLTFGGQVIIQQENTELASVLNGFNFGNTETAGFTSTGSLDTNTGNAYASFLLGLVDNASATDTSLTKSGARYKNYAAYAQDDWKVTPKFTLNLGLRYTIPKPFVESENRISFLDPNKPNPALGGFHGALTFAGSGPDSCNCKTDVKTHYLTLGPRVGFAYAVHPGTSVRASFSIVHFDGGALGGAGLSFGVSSLGYSSSPSFNSPDSGITSAFNWNNGFPAYQKPPIFSSTLNTGYTTSLGPGGGIGYDRPDTAGRSPYAENWNLTVEQELPFAMVSSLSYVGSSSHFLAVGGGSGIYSDQLDPKYLKLGNLLQQPANPVTIAQAAAIFPGVGLPFANFAGSIGQMLRPFPQYNGTGANFSGPDPWATFATASYNALQATLSRQMRNGFYFLAAYTWSKLMDEGGGTVNFIYGGARSAYNLKQERSVSNGDVPQQFSIAYVYDLPFGRGHRYGGENKLTNALVGGWRLSAIQQYSSGTPIGPIGASCNTPYTGGCYADYAPGFGGSARLHGGFGSGNPRTTSYLNLAAFQNPASFTFGNTPRTLTTLRTPLNLNESIAVGKDFRATERVGIHLQADAFNPLNRTQFGGISTNITSSNFGFVSGQANTPRQLQFEANVHF